MSTGTGPRRRELLLELARDVDIVAENFSSAEVMGTRGLDYESVRAVNPDVIYLSVSCFGRTSPWATSPATTTSRRRCRGSCT